MTNDAVRADVTSRSRGQDAWEAGVHADAEQGSIDVGLAVEPESVGVVVDAPGVGQLAIALDITGGTTRLATLRRTVGGEDVPIITDEARTTLLEGELARARQTVHDLNDRLDLRTSELNEARDRAAAHAEEKRVAAKNLAELRASSKLERETLKREAQELKTSLQVETERHLKALADREDVRAELEQRAKVRDGELSAVQARLEAELATTQDALEAEKRALSGERDRFLSELGVLEAQKASLEKQLQETKGEQSARQDERVQRLELDLEAARAEAGRVAGLESHIAELKRDLEAREHALADARDQHGSASGQATALQATVDQTRTELELTRADREQIRTELEQARAEASQARAELEQQRFAAASLQTDLDLAHQHLVDAHARIDGFPAQLEAARTSALPDTTKLEAERRATVEARDIARQLKLQVEKLTAERDEARTLARQLHQRVGTGSNVEAVKLDKERLQQQLEAERTSRAKAVAERDELRDRLNALTRAYAARGAEAARQDTLPHSFDALHPTVPEQPAVGTGEDPTDPGHDGRGRKKP